MRILLTGLMTTHMGRLENGNIGNYYIVEPTIRELHRVFPGAEIRTTLQLSSGFCGREKVSVLPMALFYSWSESDVPTCCRELGAAEIYSRTRRLASPTPFMEEVLASDLVVDLAGEMWGDHADPVGRDRFLVAAAKARTAQLLGKPVVLLAGSQGPFDAVAGLKPLAAEAMAGFAAILNREPESVAVLGRAGFDTSKVESFTDVAFLFEGASYFGIKTVLDFDGLISDTKNTVGFVVCGFNMLRGPYDADPRDDSEFEAFAEVVEHVVGGLGARAVLMSHQNGFVRDRGGIKMTNGRDWPYARQLRDVVEARANVDMRDVVLARGPYTPKQTKAIIGQFDVFVSGRIHAFVAAVSQCVPSVIVTRGHGGVSHRNLGFARSVGLERMVSDPGSADDMKAKVSECWSSREEIRAGLGTVMPGVKSEARRMFDRLAEVYANFKAKDAR